MEEKTVIGELNADRTGIEFLHGKMLSRVLHKYEGKRLEVSFKPLEHQRSGAQNRWLWGVAYVCVCAWYKETQGETLDKEHLHEYVLQHVLGVGTADKEILGKATLVSKMKKSTSQLTVAQFQEFKEKLQAHFEERGCIIPDPHGGNFITDFIKDE